MKIKIPLTALLLSLSLLTLPACLPEDQPEQTSATGITELDLFMRDTEIELKAGETESSYFTVEGTRDFSIDDIEFVSSDPSVAAFEYDRTALTTFIYYKITAKSEGTAEVYAKAKNGKVSTDKITVKVTGFPYTVAGVDDNSIPGAKRYSVRATVAADLIDGKSDDHIRRIMEYILTDYAESHRVNSLQVLLYVAGDNTSGGATVGHCSYAPFGDIGKASEVTAGDYSSFEFCDLLVFSESDRNAMRGESNISTPQTTTASTTPASPIVTTRPVTNPSTPPTTQKLTTTPQNPQSTKAPTVSTDPEPSDLLIELLYISSPVGRNETATVKIKGKPNTEYNLTVWYSTTASTAQGTGIKTSDAEGYVTWNWKVGGKTSPGEHPIQITGGGETYKTVFVTTE